MALVLDDRVQETTTVTGTGTATLLGAVQGFQSFAAIGNANTTYYTIAGQGTSEWEVGLGTYTSSGTTLARTTVLESSNAGSLVNFSAGTKNVFVTYPASQATLLNVTQTLTNKTLTSPTVTGAVMSSMASSVITSGTVVSSTSGTAIDFTSIPSWAKRITVNFYNVSLSGTNQLILQLGSASGGIETTGYVSTATIISSGSSASGTSITSGLAILQNSAAVSLYSGQFTLSLLDATNNVWTHSGAITSGGVNSQIGMGAKALSSTLDRIRILPTGANTFDSGSINILYE